MQDVALASVSMRPIPFSPVLEKLCLTDSKYGSVRRFYIETTEDNAIPIALQQNLISNNPPEQVFHLKGADHSPFFSKPQGLHRILVDISRIPSTWSCFAEFLIIRNVAKLLLCKLTMLNVQSSYWCTCSVYPITLFHLLYLWQWEFPCGSDSGKGMLLDLNVRNKL